MIEPSHPLRKLAEAIERGGPIPDAYDPRFLNRLAEHASYDAQYTIERGMTDMAGNLTGPGFYDIMSRLRKDKNNDGQSIGDAYAIARWAVGWAEKNKSTGVDLAAAFKIIDEQNAGGIVVPPEDVRRIAAAIGVPIFDHAPGTHVDTDRLGPHYMPPTREIHMFPPGDPFYSRIGAWSNYDVVFAHEIGHAVADHMTILSGFRGLSSANAEALRQELTINSRQYKPEWWQNKTTFAKAQQVHIRKNEELLADAFATWMTEPGARARMPVFQRIIAQSGATLNPYGLVPPRLGTDIT